MMIERRKIRLFFAIAIVICAVTLLMIKDNKIHEASSTSVAPEPDIDFFISKAVFTAFDIKGEISQCATSERIEHFKQEKYSVLAKPIIHNHQNEKTTATITSQVAKTYDQDDAITFYSNVIVKSFDNGSEDATLKTEELSYNQSLNHVSTNEDVEITDIIGNITTATGLESDLTLETIHLKSNVKGTFNVK